MSRKETLFVRRPGKAQAFLEVFLLREALVLLRVLAVLAAVGGIFFYSGPGRAAVGDLVFEKPPVDLDWGAVPDAAQMLAPNSSGTSAPEPAPRRVGPRGQARGASRAPGVNAPPGVPVAPPPVSPPYVPAGVSPDAAGAVSPGVPAALPPESPPDVPAGAYPAAAGAAPPGLSVAPPPESPPGVSAPTALELQADAPGVPVAAPPDAAGRTADTGRAVRLFGTVEFRSRLKGIPKWERVLRAYNNRSGIDGAFGPTRQREAQAWQRIKASVAKAGDLEKARAVNAFFNQWPYRLDSNVYGVSDYWATPDEFIKNSGDCEDYAITKLYALRQLGVNPDNLRVVALRDNIRNLDHAVLAVYIGKTIYILDNVTKLVLTHDQFQHYFPYFSVNAAYKWAHIPPK